jgi:hypothetical protein
MKNPADPNFSRLTGAFILFLILGLSTSLWAYEHRSSNANSVQVDVVPVQMSPGQAAKFEIRMNTHSVPLNYDMVAVSLIKDDLGREYRPLAWNGSPPGGHHRSGILEFPNIPEGTGSITLYIKSIADVPERSFEWKLEGK